MTRRLHISLRCAAVVAAVLAGGALAACGGDDDAGIEDTNTDGSTTSSAATPSDDGGTDDVASEDVVGTMVIDGETYDAVLKSGVQRFGRDEPLAPCGLDGDPISLVVSDPEGELVFVALETEPDLLNVILTGEDDLFWREGGGTIVNGIVEGSTFSYSRTLDDSNSDTAKEVEVSVTC